MKVLVIGQGGREHAIAWKLSQSNKVKDIFIAPGNGGTALENKCTNLDIDIDDFKSLKEHVEKRKIDLIIVGPEDPLVNGISDYFKNTNMKLGQTVNLNTLGAALMDVDGVTDIVTRRTDTGLVVQGLSICIWNPVYDTDITISTQNVTLPGFKFPYLHNSYDLISKIVVE